MSHIIDLQARRHESRVLGAWLAGRAGGAQRAAVPLARQEGAPPRAGVQALGENGFTTNLTAEELMNTLGLAATSAAGVAVTPDSAIRVATVYGCVSLLAGAIMTLPLPVYERVGDSRKRADHEYWWMLNEQANPDMTAATAWQCLVSSRKFYGDAFAELLRASSVSSRVIGWKPLHPLNVQPFRAENDRVYYRVQPAKGAAYVLDSADMIHLPSLGFDGLTSPSPITFAAREAIGTSIAAERHTARFFAGGATFDYALKTASNLKTEQIDQLRTSLLARVQNGGRGPLILSGGLEPAQISVNSKDAEILATRLFSVEEICRIFGVPPFMVGHNEKTTSWGSGIEQMSIAFVRYTLQRDLTLIAQEFNRKLWPTRARYFVEHLTAALERGDLKSRFEAYRIAVGRAGEPGWTSPNEVRRLENMPPVDGGDALNTGASNAQPTPATAG